MASPEAGTGTGLKAYWWDRQEIPVQAQARGACLLIGILAPVAPIGALVLNLARAISNNGGHKYPDLTVFGYLLRFEDVVVAVGSVVLVSVWLLTMWMVVATRESHPMTCVFSAIGLPGVLVSMANYVPI